MDTSREVRLDSAPFPFRAKRWVILAVTSSLVDWLGDVSLVEAAWWEV